MGEAAGDAPRRRREHPSGWSRGAGREGDPRAAQDGGPGGVWSSRSVWAPRGTRGCSRCLAPGEARALPSLRSLSAFPPVTLPHPARSPSAGPRLAPRRAPAPLEARLFSRAPGSCSHGRASTRALHRPLRGGAGGKQAAAAWLLIHHLQPPRGSARNASSRERWGRGEQGPPAPARRAKMELRGCAGRPKGDGWCQQRGRGGKEGSGRGKGAVRCSQSKGGIGPCGTEGTFAGSPKLCFALGRGSPDTSFGGPPAAQPPAAPRKCLQLAGAALGSASA